MLIVHFAWAFANGTAVAHDCVGCLVPKLPEGPFKYRNGGPERLLGKYGTFSRIPPFSVHEESVPILRTVAQNTHELGVAWFYIVPGATARANLSSLNVFYAEGFLEQSEWNSRDLHDWMVERGYDALVRSKSKHEVPMQLVLLLKNAGALEVPCPDHDAIIDCVDYKNVAIGTTAVVPAIEPMCPERDPESKEVAFLVLVFVLLVIGALTLLCYLFRQLQGLAFPSYEKVSPNLRPPPG